MHLLQSKIFSPKIFKDMDEPMIIKDRAVFLQRSKRNSRIAIYNGGNGQVKFVPMKGLFCFNAHADENKMAFEFSGSSRGKGILYFENYTMEELEGIKAGAVLSDVWNDAVVLKYGNSIILYDIASSTEKLIINCPNMIGIPASGGGICAWLQICRNEYCINMYSLKDNYKLIFVPHGMVTNMYVQGRYIVYKCIKGKSNIIFAYEMITGNLTQISNSENWIELYPGTGETITWTVRKRIEGRYVFDLWAYSIRQRLLYKIACNCKNIIIPASSENLVIWVESCSDGDSLYSANIS